jgi:uncharacterized protein DUF4058
MPSPFPGMDPYLEGYLWPDVHNALAAKLRQLLTPLLRPHYTARLAIYMVEDIAPESEIGIMYPDVEVLLSDQARTPSPSRQERPADGALSGVFGTPAPLTLPVLQPIDVQVVNVEIRDAAHNRLVTCIEILSPVNKREPGLTVYRQKRQRLYQAGVHLIELDFIRRGTRPYAHPRIPDVPYVITVIRAHTGLMDIWPLGLRDTLPIVPVPLRPPDSEVLLDLPLALTSIYDEAAYDLSIDYRQPPPPPVFSEADTQWMHALLG